MHAYETGQELLTKVDWEGGPYDAVVNYGIRTEEVPEYLQPAWAKLQEAAKAFQAAWNEVEKLVDEKEDFVI